MFCESEVSSVLQTYKLFFLYAHVLFDTDRALYWNLPASLVFTTLLVYVGLVLFARYGENDPVGCVIHRRDQVKCLIKNNHHSVPSCIQNLTDLSIA